MSDKMNTFTELVISDRELYDAVSKTMSNTGFVSGEIMRLLDDPENNDEVKKMFNNIVKRNSYDEETEEVDRVYYDRILKKLNMVCEEVGIILDK